MFKAVPLGVRAKSHRPEGLFQRGSLYDLTFTYCRQTIATRDADLVREASLVNTALSVVKGTGLIVL